jgi:hypothetical protein
MLFHLRVHMPPPFWGYRLPLGEHELLTLPEHLSSLLVAEKEETNEQNRLTELKI